MAQFGGVHLLASGSAVFELTNVSDAERSIVFDGDTQAIVPAAARFVVVTTPGSSFADVHDAGRAAANRALDIYYSCTGKALALAQRSSPVVVTWTEAGHRRTRLVGRALQEFRMEATAEIRDPEGNVVTPTPLPDIAWQECLRYYRVSEASTDLFDSFRNLYLGIESLLSLAYPPRSDESETRWLKRALNEAGQVVRLEEFAPTQTPWPHEAIHQELYRDLRTAMFHAKTGRATWLPQAWESRPSVIQARVRYARMFRKLADHHLNVRFRSGGLYRQFWEQITRDLMGTMEVFVSDDPTPVDSQALDDDSIAPAGGNVLKLSTQLHATSSGPWAVAVIGERAANEVRQVLRSIQRFGTLSGGGLAMAESLTAPLSMDDLDDVEVVLISEGRNYGQPREDFET